MAGCKSPQQIWEHSSSKIVQFVELVFYNLGIIVAQNPWRTVVISWFFVLLSSLGLLRFHIEKNPMNLWVPPESDFYIDTQWYIDKFESGFRFQKVLATAENVLEPKILLQLNDINEKIQLLNITLGNNVFSFKDLCFKVPVVRYMSSDSNSRPVSHKKSAEITHNGKYASPGTDNLLLDMEDPTLLLDSQFYCSLLETFPLHCLEDNILDVWNHNSSRISNLSLNDVITQVNETTISPSTGHPMNYKKLLGGVEYDSTGHVVSAKSLLFVWYAQVNFSSVNLDDEGNLVGTEDWVSKALALWEKEFLDLMSSLSKNATGLSLSYEAGRSYGDISKQTMFLDMDKLFVGIFLMFIYIQFILSRFNWLEIRLILGSVGLLCVGMAYITACSWCSLFGIPFGPVHSSLPFLLMGLGIDDMFVMKACWEHLSANELKRPLPVKIGIMLKHAGVSIVITSFTDIVALLIGSITILPSLRSFCFYGAMGVFFIFCFSVTFYVAVFTLDIKRIDANRNGILYCYKHKSQINISKTESMFQKCFDACYKNFIFTLPVKIIVIVFTVVVTCFSINGILHLEQRFDPSWFIPDGTYYKNFLDEHKFYYPEEGNVAMVFMGEMNYSSEFPKLYTMVQEIRSQPYVYDLSTWVEHFHAYVLKNFKQDLRNITVSDYDFHSLLSKFLFSPKGGQFQINFRFKEPLSCGILTSNITASSMLFKFARFEGPEEYIPAMNRIKHIVKSVNITTGDGYHSVWSRVFANWATDEIIGVEVERNIELALLCVMACTVILITNLQMCFWIFICVLLTLVNVLGWMQRWGMTVDIVCCIGLELAIGLCVDYAAHVGHTFLTIAEGSRQERALQTVTSIGTAVLFGGGSMLLSLSLLSMSKAYTFQAFFKIFLLVILFGLFNGLIFLPVVLSLAGPRAYHTNSKPKMKDGNKTETLELNGKTENVDE